MAGVLEKYFTDLRQYLKLDQSAEDEVLKELDSHVADRIEEFKESGLSEDEASERCVTLLGSAKSLARQMYEAHSQGTWRQVILASLPHLFFAIIFTLRLFTGIQWLPVVLGVIFLITLFGWGHGKPAWLFPWLGYTLFPAVVTGILLLYLPRGWSVSFLILYIPLVLWLMFYIIIKSIKKDWPYIALALLPVPTFIGWSLAVSGALNNTGINIEHLRQFAPWTGLSFLALGLTVAFFLRLRQRWAKIAAMVACSVVTLCIVSVARNEIHTPTFLVLGFLTFILLIVPAVIGHRTDIKKAGLK